MYIYAGQVERVVDGDTLDVNIDLGFDIYHKVRVRLARINAPEIHNVKKDSLEYKRGMKAKAFVQKWVTLAPTVYVQTFKDTKGKYGRYVAHLYHRYQDTSFIYDNTLSHALVEAGLAVEKDY